jgi:hypothetical protein
MTATTKEEIVMKKTIRNFVMLMAVALALTGLSLAQSLTDRVVANVPFSFYAGDQQYPAGTYEFALNDQNHTVILTNTASNRSKMILALPGESLGYGNQARQGFNNLGLQFDTIGGAYVLASLKTNVAGVNFPEEAVRLGSTQRGEPVTIVASLR